MIQEAQGFFIQYIRNILPTRMQVYCVIMLLAFTPFFAIGSSNMPTDANDKGLSKFKAFKTKTKTKRARKISSKEFKKLTKQFNSSLSAKTTIQVLKGMQKKYSNAFIRGHELAAAFGNLPTRTKDEMEEKIDKIIFAGEKVTFKLKRGVSYIKINNVTPKGKRVTFKIGQGATILFSENTSSQLTAKMQGVSMWTAIKYSTLKTIKLNAPDNTLSVYSCVGIGFWTSYEMGSVNRRFR